MKLIIGLGNPGQKYQSTWHNLGFLALDRLSQSHDDSFHAARLNKKCQAVISTGAINDKKIILAKPQTFMNNSGEAVAALLQYYKIKPADLWVIHDDVDLPLGTLRISVDASAGGHKGIQSIIEQLGSQQFVRFRLGINQSQKTPTETYVLQKINQPATIDKVLTATVEAMTTVLSAGLDQAMNRFN